MVGGGREGGGRNEKTESSAQLTVIILVFSEHLFHPLLSLLALASCRQRRGSQPYHNPTQQLYKGIERAGGERG